MPRRLLFLHPNFPGQFGNLAAALAADPDYEVVGVGHRSADGRPVAGVRLRYYDAFPLVEFEAYAGTEQFTQQVRRGRAAAEVFRDLAAEGFHPDVVIAHPGWGDTLFLKDVFPEARLIPFMEFYYRRSGTDLGFDPEFPPSPADVEFLRLRNIPSVMAYEISSAAVCPTAWQASLFPETIRSGLTVLHEGIDTEALTPRADVSMALASGRVLTRADEVLTYVSRGLEPLRGFHTFMRALPEVQRRRPEAITIIVGSDQTHYGRRPSGAANWREALLAELDGRLDLSRILFTGRIPYSSYVDVLNLSTVHAYLTYPFVLSWSLLEAMAAGCALVASRTAPVQEVIEDGRTGLLVDPLDPGAVAAALSDLLEDRALGARLGEAARDLVTSRYDFRRHALPRYKALIDQVLSRPPVSAEARQSATA